MNKKTIQKNLLILVGLLFILNYNLSAVQAMDFSDLLQPIYMHAATSADPIVYSRKTISVPLTVKESSSHGAITAVIDKIEANISVKKVEDNLEPTLDQIKNYVRAESQKAGLNSREVEAIINCESRWITDAKGVNKNGSYDLGLWQINSIHKNITDAEKLDYKSATKWAIAKRLRDGNWSAWYCARRIAIK